MKESKFSGVFIVKNERILLVQESHKEAHGLWSIPLGHVEENESESQAAIRETKEETGYDVILGKSTEIKLGGESFKSTGYFNDHLIILTIYNAQIQDGELKSGSDVLDAKWFTLHETKRLSLRGDWLRTFIKNEFPGRVG